MIEGDKKIGFTFHYIDANIDTGNIIIQKEIIVEDFDTQATLYHRVMFEAAKYFLSALNKVKAGEIGVPQTSSGKYFNRGCPFNGVINPKWSLLKIERFIRAMNYPPLPYATYKGIEIKTMNDYLRLINDNEESTN
jgi:methionyl-tRNA formyltransferase